MNIVLKGMAIGLSLIAGSQAMDTPMDEENPKKRTASDVNLEPSERDQKCLRLSTPIDFKLLGDIQALIWETTFTTYFKKMSYSDSFKKIFFLRFIFGGDENKNNPINKDSVKRAILGAYAAYGACEENYENCLIFLNGELRYIPDKGEPIFLPIASLKNPFSDVFDISQCGDAGEYLSINTGYRKGKITENGNKVEIWFTPWFMVENDLNTTAKHLEPIFSNWKKSEAPIGIFWNLACWRGVDCYEHLTSASLVCTSSANLSNLYAMSHSVGCSRFWVINSMRSTSPSTYKMTQQISCSFLKTKA